jgi:hypothetical protein
MMQKSLEDTEVLLEACRAVIERLMQVEMTFPSTSVGEEKARGDDSY